MSETQIAKLLGHATTQTTKRYTHLRPKHLRDTVTAIEAGLTPKASAPAVE